MSNKKKKRHHNKQGSSPYRRSEESILADEMEHSAKKFNPKARNLLLVDLAILALAALGERYGFLPQPVTLAITILGVILLVVALWYQFSGGGRKGVRNSMGPRL